MRDTPTRSGSGRRVWRNGESGSSRSSVRDEDMAYAIAAYEAVLAENPLVARSASRLESACPEGHREPAVLDEDRARETLLRAPAAEERASRISGPRCSGTICGSGIMRAWVYARKGDLRASRSGIRWSTAVPSMVREIIADEHLWGDGEQIGDTLMAIPALSGADRAGAGRIRFGARRARRTISGARRAACGRTASSAEEARLARANLYVTVDRFDEALADVEALLAGPTLALSRGELELLSRARFSRTGWGGMRRRSPSSGRSARRPPGTAYRPALCSISPRSGSKRGEMSSAAQDARGVWRSGKVAPEIRTAAMFLRAVAANEGGDWGEAVTLLWRICRLYPFSRAGMVAPLDHDPTRARRGNSSRPRRVFSAKRWSSTPRRSRENSASLSYRHLVKDYLIESYLIMGDPLGAAKLLEERAPAWIRRKRCGRADQKCADIFELTR